ncbi:MAG: late competence development ComFB family protein [Spirochaetota bacterium]
MALADRYNLEDLVNEAERLVLDELDRQLDARGDEDLEEDLILDMAAYALNHVTPLYRVNLLGRLYAQNVPEEYRREVAEAVEAAVSKVLSEPSQS